jgi:hypothetical protein
MTFQAEENLANGIFQQLQPVPLGDTGKMLFNEDPVDPPAIEEGECEIAGTLTDNFIPMLLILRMNIPSALS